jgi:hypothetical protein
MIYTVLQSFNLNLDKKEDLNVFDKIIDLNTIQQKLNARISIILDVELNSNLTLNLTPDLITQLNNKLNHKENQNLKEELNINMVNILNFNFLILKKILTELKITVEFLYSYEYKNIDYDPSNSNLEELRKIIFNNDTNTDKKYTRFYHENLNNKLDKFFTDFNKFKDELEINNKLTEFKDLFKEVEEETVRQGGNNKKSKYILYLNKFDLNVTSVLGENNISSLVPKP